MDCIVLGIKRIDRVRNTMLLSKSGIASMGRTTAELKWVGRVTLAGGNPRSEQNSLLFGCPKTERDDGAGWEGVGWMISIAFKTEWWAMAEDTEQCRILIMQARKQFPRPLKRQEANVIGEHFYCLTILMVTMVTFSFYTNEKKNFRKVCYIYG